LANASQGKGVHAGGGTGLLVQERSQRAGRFGIDPFGG
jgi:hypothetical protein